MAQREEKYFRMAKELSTEEIEETLATDRWGIRGKPILERELALRREAEQAESSRTLPVEAFAIPKIEYRGWFSLTEALHYPSRGRESDVEHVNWEICVKTRGNKKFERSDKNKCADFVRATCWLGNAWGVVWEYDYRTDTQKNIGQLPGFNCE